MMKHLLLNIYASLPRIASIVALTLGGFLLSPLSLNATSLPAGYHPGGDEYEAEDDALFLPAIVKFSSEDELQEILGEEGILLRRRGNLALTYLPNKEREEIEKKTPRKSDENDSRKGHGGNARIDIGRTVSPTLDKAKAFYGASRVLTGDNLPKAFTGKGVVVGICDIGFDPSHPAFHDPLTGESRVRRITQYKEAQGERIDMRSPEEYITWTTDTTAHYHATHVAGILTGADDSLGYGGIASGADIVISTSQLSDVGLLAGVEDILEYAREVGKPAVVNLSMGNYTGPHDGTSLFSQYLDMLGEEALICLSAGNEGNEGHSNSVTLHFTEENRSYGQRIHNYKWNQFDIQGMTDIWSADMRSLRLTPVVYDETISEIIYRFPTIDLHSGREWGVSTLENPRGFEEADAEFRRYYEGWIYAEGGINSENGRYNLSLLYDLHTTTESDAGPWARYNIGFLVEGEPGQRADVFTDGSYSRLRQIPGSPAPGSSFSISDLATGHNVLCVGMHTTRRSYPLATGGLKGDYDEGTVNVNSSYATLLDGRVYPHTVAPGFIVVSAGSAPFLAANPNYMEDVCAISRTENKTWYWQPDGGTSMSSPYVAGFLATWLEADPTLTISDVKRIIASTNHTDVPDPDNPRHGQGWFDAYEGLKMVLRNVSVDSIDAVNPLPVLEMKGGRLLIFNPADEQLIITIADTQGRMLQQTASTTDSEIDLSHLSGQMLLISARTGDGSSHRHTVLKAIPR